MSIVAFIPARYASSRFPGKPLAMLKGISMLQRVWASARAVSGLADVYIATDDERLAEFAKGFGASVVMTGADIANGTLRVLAAAETLKTQPTHVINVQGDAVLTPPWVIAALAEVQRSQPEVEIVTPATRFNAESLRHFQEQKVISPSSGTTVTFDRDHRALYFSKSIIPFVRSGVEASPVYRHIGMYAYRLDALRRYVTLPEGQFERAEKLEQLRALENGMCIKVVEVDYRGRTHWSIDSPEDLRAAEALIDKEGELLPVYDGSYRWGKA